MPVILSIEVDAKRKARSGMPASGLGVVRSRLAAGQLAWGRFRKECLSNP